VKKIEQVGDRGPEPLDLQAIDRVDMANNFLGRVATRTGVEQATERPLVLRVFVDIGYAELRLPEKGMVSAFENLTLLGDGMNDRFERRSPVGDAERAALDLTNDLANTTPDRAEVFQPFVPQKPASVGCARIVTPTGNKTTNEATVILSGSNLVGLRGHIVGVIPIR